MIKFKVKIGGEIMLIFIKKIVKGQRNIYLFILFILSILSACEFLLISIYSCYQNESINARLLLMKSIPAIAILVSFFLTMLVNNYFINSKREELSIILLSGCLRSEIIRYIILQFGILFIVSDLFGIGIGMISTKLIKLLYNNFNFNYMILFKNYFGILICKLIYIFILNLGKFIRVKTNIVDIISNRENSTNYANYFTSKRLENSKTKSPIFTFFVIIVAITVIILSINNLYNEKNISSIPIYFSLFLISEIILINKAIPLLFDILHNKLLLTSPNLIMILSNVIDASRTLVSMINILACVIPICISCFFFGISNKEIQIVTYICYYVLLTVMFMSFILRFYVYIPFIKTNIATMKALGYDKVSLLKIYKNVILFLLLLILVIPILLYSIMLYKAYCMHFVSLMNAIILIFSYMIVLLLLGFIMQRIYINAVWEVYDDVKYLNRSL